MSPVAGTQSGGVMNDIPGEPYQGIKANFQVIYKKVEHHLFAWHHIITSNLKTGREIKVKNQNSLLFWKQNNKEKYFPSLLILVSVQKQSVWQTYLNTEHWCYIRDSPLVRSICVWICHQSGSLNNTSLPAHFICSPSFLNCLWKWGGTACGAARGGILHTVINPPPSRKQIEFNAKSPSRVGGGVS